MKKKYSQAIVGGTFDRFHDGHKKLLDTAFSETEFVTVGISTEQLYKDKFLSATIEDYQTRELSIKNYLAVNKLESRSKLVSIDDMYGTSLQIAHIDAIFVTKENEKAAEMINQKRVKHGLSTLEVVIVPLVKGNDGLTITSERIRRGEIDRMGHAYALLFQNGSLHLPQNLRDDLRTPIGNVSQRIEEIVSAIEKAPMVIAVGDIVSLTLAEAGRQADVSFIDLKTRRHELQEKQEKLLKTLSPTFVAENKPAEIEKEAVEFLQKAFESFLQTGQKQTVKILGEEDLLTLPAILLAPLKSVVLYGQFDEGAVIVEVTEEKKIEVQKIVKKFVLST